MAKSKLQKMQQEQRDYRCAAQAIEKTRPGNVEIKLLPENAEELEHELGSQYTRGRLAFTPHDNNFTLYMDSYHLDFPWYLGKPLLEALKNLIEEETPNAN
jgi:hypothetical protein